MSGLINFNAQVAPMEHVEKVVRQEQQYSQVKLQSGMQEAGRMLSKDNEQVQETAESQKGQRVERRKHGKEQNASPERQPANKKSEPDSGQEQDIPEISPDVWSGNILNLKV